jgi:glutamate-1-semialdehyde 2,1-aminomutase
MSCLDPRNRGALWHSGTFNGNPLTCAAGLVSVRELTQERIDRMERLGERLAQELKKAAMAVELPFSVRRVGSLMNVFFLNEPPPPTIARDDAKLMAEFHLAMLNHGLFLAPRGLIALSTVMTDELMNEIIQRASQALHDVASLVG